MRTHRSCAAQSSITIGGSCSGPGLDAASASGALFRITSHLPTFSRARYQTKVSTPKVKKLIYKSFILMLSGSARKKYFTLSLCEDRSPGKKRVAWCLPIFVRWVGRSVGWLAGLADVQNDRERIDYKNLS